MVSPARRSSLARSLIGIGAESHPRSGNPPIPSYYGVAPRRLLPGAGGAIVRTLRRAGWWESARAFGSPLGPESAELLSPTLLTRLTRSTQAL